MPGKFDSILLVDDDKTTNHFNKLLLEGMQLCEQIHLAYDGQEAIEIIEKHYASLKEVEEKLASIIFLDLHMPMMNGLEFLEKLYSNEASKMKNLWVVLLTSSNNTEDFEKVKNYKIANILKKPLTTEKVKLVIQEALKLQA